MASVATVIQNVLTDAQIQAIVTQPAVAEAQQRLASGQRQVYFGIDLTADVRQSLEAALGVDLSRVQSLPMRWIQGDMFPHVDAGTQPLEATHLVYLNDAPGQLEIDGAAYPITRNTGYVFSEGQRHQTTQTEGVARLLIGPMSEQGLPVGSNNTYFLNETDAVNMNFGNAIAYGSSYTVGTIDGGNLMGITSWRIASSSSGSSSQANVYVNGSTLIPDGTYYLYPGVPCLLEGSKLLAVVDGKETYVPIETLRPGSLVKTSRDGVKKVVLIGKGSIENPATDERTESRLYVCTKEAYPELTEDLVLTGCHSLLVGSLTQAQREAITKTAGRIFVTDQKYRLMAWLDERAKPWKTAGSHTIWHLALENADDGMNYGVYANGGLLVETCSIRFLKQKSNMTFVE